MIQADNFSADGGGGGYVTSGAWATIAALTGYPAYTMAWCTSGPGFAAIYTGSRWKPAETHICYSTLAAEVTTDASGNEVVVDQILLPAGLLIVASVLDFDIQLTKSSNGSAATPRIRIGSAGTTADAEIVAATFAAGNRSIRMMPKIRVVSATTVGSLVTMAGTFGTGTSTVWPADVTIPNVSTALYVTITVDSAGTETFTLKSSELNLRGL